MENFVDPDDDLPAIYAHRLIEQELAKSCESMQSAVVEKRLMSACIRGRDNIFRTLLAADAG